MDSTIREKLLTTIDPACDHCQYDRGTCKEDGHYFCKEQTNVIFALIRAKVEGIKNPYQGAYEDHYLDELRSFEQCRQAVLKALGE